MFAPDGKLARLLNRLGDLMMLNIITLVCCIPIVTIGASLTALYSVTLKMARNEEGKVIPLYVKAFRENFKQGTILWLIGGGILGLLVFDIYLVGFMKGDYTMAYKGVLLSLLILVSMIVMYLFPVLARFDNTTKNTIKNAILFCMIHFMKSIFLLVANIMPFAVLLLSMRFFPVYVLVGISGPAYVTSLYYRSVFQKFEQRGLRNVGNS